MFFVVENRDVSLGWTIVKVIALILGMTIVRITVMRDVVRQDGGQPRL